MVNLARRDGYTEYDPDTITTYRIFNSNYATLNNVKIRLADASDPDTRQLDRGDSIDLTFGKDSEGRTALFYGGDVVQQIDFNDGHSADDLTMPGYNGNDDDSGQIQYNSGNTWGTIFDVLNFQSTDFLNKFDDKDGIDGGEAAKFTQYIKDSSIIVLDISV
ncbi:hypothetical protein [Photorhabdus luminescens]|uniref:hypothetical protein n=1 Tax=Photorhabdus luminescens TaxID=29488 RepID=UPI00223EE431|nr:hypothetical protein [Photorhabdus luminescens]MCW7762096.1 hypothetical protein [Photorhabdus luminescens subsp. venezuelensis]